MVLPIVARAAVKGRKRLEDLLTSSTKTRSGVPGKKTTASLGTVLGKANDNLRARMPTLEQTAERYRPKDLPERNGGVLYQLYKRWDAFRDFYKSVDYDFKAEHAMDVLETIIYGEDPRTVEFQAKNPVAKGLVVLYKLIFSLYAGVDQIFTDPFGSAKKALDYVTPGNRTPDLPATA